VVPAAGGRVTGSGFDRTKRKVRRAPLATVDEMVTSSKASDTQRWRAVMAKDAAADGAFVFAVRTTGVFCRPSCGARRPRRENVQFFADHAAAIAAGFRACRRCQPLAPHADAQARTALVAQVCRWLDREQPPTLAELAARSGYSQWHLQRVFTAAVGVSPKAYATARRAARLQRELAAGAAVTVAMHRTGYGSTSRLQRGAERAVGMLPKRARDGGRGERITAVVVACSLGRALVAATERGLCAILLGDDDEALFADLHARFPHAEHQRGDRAFQDSVRAAIACVDGQATDPGLPLDVRGTAFQQRVWTALRALPTGRTIDYAGLARSLGMPRGARAVAAACAANPIAVVVPCHRVVRGCGDLAGYRWGIERKRALLSRERNR
jgi:AraC family transcriptional regulator, regulatory protein of adaptative response / methylated-DNA-[protein]-cysteine methyltransferase